jgi:hypothetical protein
MATFVLKIKYGEVLRRIIVPQREARYPPCPATSFSELEERIRTMFKIPSSSEIVVTYTDKDNDVITLAGDEDLYDACAVQGLNPLRLHVTSLVATQAPAPKSTGSSGFRRCGFAKTCGQRGGFGGWGPLFWNIPEVHLMGAFDSSPAAPSADEGVTSAAGNTGNPTAVSSTDATVGASDAEDVNRVRHFGVQCDSCNMLPIVGPRFKSNKKFDFDLCQACFQKTGCADDDYTRMERPIFHRRHFPSVSERRDVGACPWTPSCYSGRPLFATRGARGGHGSLASEPVCCSGRLVAPFGGKLGHRVWVLVQVDEDSPQVAESLVDTGRENAQESDKKVEKSEELAADQPVADDGVLTQSEVEGVTRDVIKNQVPSALSVNTEDVGIVEPAQDTTPARQLEVGKVDELEVTTDIAAPLTKEPQIVGDDVGKEQEEGGVESGNELGNFSMVEIPEETAILATLERMGFKDSSWNMELLKINNNNMQRTLDDLIMSAEWAPKLQELEEMGFNDKELNRRLMMKNKGSLKRVVQEFVYMYKNPAGKGEE